MLSVIEKTKIQNVALVGVILILVLGNSLPVSDPDVWWHLQVGKDIISNMEVPDSDYFSFSNAGHRWVAHEWLAEVIYYRIYESFGYQGLLVFNTLLLLCAFFLLYRTVMFQTGGNTGISAILLILSSVLNSVFWMFRPHVPAYLLFVLYIHILYGNCRIRKKIIALPLLMILWVNIHGSYIVGLGLLLVYLLSGIFRIHLGKMSLRELGGKEVRLMAGVTALTALAVLINPNTYHIVLYPFETIGSGTITSNVEEWLSPDFHRLGMKLFLAYILFTFSVVAISYKKVFVDEMVNLVVFTALSLFGARNLALFVFVSIPILARHLSSLIKRETRNFQVPVLNIAALLVLAVLLVMLWPRPGSIEEHLAQGEFPVKAVQYMKERRLDGNVFNEYDWGGYLIWSRYPDNKVFVDGRADIYADRVIPDYIKITAAGEDSYPVFTRYNADYVLMRKGQPFIRLLAEHEDWEKLYADETAVLLGRVQGNPNRRQAEGSQ